MSFIDADPKIERMRKISFFRNAKKKAMAHLASAADEVTVEAGRTLIQQGRNHAEAYVVERGEAEVIVNEDVVATIGEGELIGEVGIFCGGFASATIVAKTEMDVLVIPYNRIETILEENPEMVRAIAEELAERLRAMDARHQ